MSWLSSSLTLACESVSPRVCSVDGTRIKGMPRWLISTSIVLRSQMARMARLHSSPVIVHTSVRLLICLLVSILTQLEGWMQQAFLKKRHSREGEWPLRTQETLDLHHTKTSWSPESLRPLAGG